MGSQCLFARKNSDMFNEEQSNEQQINCDSAIPTINETIKLRGVDRLKDKDDHGMFVNNIKAIIIHPNNTQNSIEIIRSIAKQGQSATLVGNNKITKNKTTKNDVLKDIEIHQTTPKGILKNKKFDFPSQGMVSQSTYSNPLTSPQQRSSGMLDGFK